MMTMGGSGWRTWGVNTVSVMKKKAPKGNNNIIHVVPPESLAYKRTKCTCFPKHQSCYQNVLKYDL